MMVEFGLGSARYKYQMIRETIKCYLSKGHVILTDIV